METSLKLRHAMFILPRKHSFSVIINAHHGYYITGSISEVMSSGYLRGGIHVRVF